MAQLFTIPLFGHSHVRVDAWNIGGEESYSCQRLFRFTDPISINLNAPTLCVLVFRFVCKAPNAAFVFRRAEDGSIKKEVWVREHRFNIEGLMYDDATEYDVVKRDCFFAKRLDHYEATRAWPKTWRIAMANVQASPAMTDEKIEQCICDVLGGNLYEFQKHIANLRSLDLERLCPHHEAAICPKGVGCPLWPECKEGHAWGYDKKECEECPAAESTDNDNHFDDEPKPDEVIINASQKTFSTVPAML
ncbi:MAG: hypothetical protein ABW189_08440 [Rickettsiales bacterium]